MPHIEKLGRCLAPDLISLGRSGKLKNLDYRYGDHARYLEAWVDAVAPSGPVIIVINGLGCFVRI